MLIGAAVGILIGLYGLVAQESAWLIVGVLSFVPNATVLGMERHFEIGDD